VDGHAAGWPDRPIAQGAGARRRSTRHSPERPAHKSRREPGKAGDRSGRRRARRGPPCLARVPAPVAPASVSSGRSAGERRSRRGGRTLQRRRARRRMATMRRGRAAIITSPRGRRRVRDAKRRRICPDLSGVGSPLCPPLGRSTRRRSWWHAVASVCARNPPTPCYVVCLYCRPADRRTSTTSGFERSLEGLARAAQRARTTTSSPEIVARRRELAQRRLLSPGDLIRRSRRTN